MDNLFENSDDSEGNESKAGPDIDEIPEDNEIPGEHQLADEEEEREEKDGGYFPVVPAPDVNWDIIYETRPGRMVLDILFQLNQSQEQFNLVGPCVMMLSPLVLWENKTLMETTRVSWILSRQLVSGYFLFLLGWGSIVISPFHLSASIHARISQTTLLCSVRVCLQN
jgi:hypothetical protein